MQKQKHRISRGGGRKTWWDENQPTNTTTQTEMYTETRALVLLEGVAVAMQNIFRTGPKHESVSEKVSPLQEKRPPRTSTPRAMCRYISEIYAEEPQTSVGADTSFGLPVCTVHKRACTTHAVCRDGKPHHFRFDCLALPFENG